jgi:copper chaperone NosL
MVNKVRFGILILLTNVMIVACTTQDSATAVAIEQGTACSLDGMLLSDYPGPKAQIHYAGSNKPVFFCDTVEMFSMVLQPEERRKIIGVFTQDMGKADWNKPRGNWIDARSAYYVYGKKVIGSMGPTYASFASKDDAEHYAKKFHGKIVQFKDVTADMADLRGGAKHDHAM